MRIYVNTHNLFTILDDRVMPPLLCKKPTLELTTKIHIRYGFALIQKDIHNKTTQEFLALDKLLEMKSNKWNSMIKRSGNSTESIEKTIRMIREANYRTTMVVLAQAARIPKATPSEMLTGPNYKQIQSPTCANNKTKLFAGMLMFNHVSTLISNMTDFIRSHYIKFELFTCSSCCFIFFFFSD